MQLAQDQKEFKIFDLDTFNWRSYNTNLSNQNAALTFATEKAVKDNAKHVIVNFGKGSSVRFMALPKKITADHPQVVRQIANSEFYVVRSAKAI